jgi:ankyrin repeat protein
MSKMIRDVRLFFKPCHFTHIDIMELLIKKNVKVNDKDIYGKTPLFLCLPPKTLRCSDYDVVKSLIGHSADVNIRDNNGQTPLHIAVDFTNVMKSLLNKNGDVNSQANDCKNASS